MLSGLCCFLHLLSICAGTYAEFMCVDEEQLARMPDNMSFQEAAALPLVTLTAWQVPRWDICCINHHFPDCDLPRNCDVSLLWAVLPSHPCYVIVVHLIHKSATCIVTCKDINISHK